MSRAEATDRSPGRRAPASTSVIVALEGVTKRFGSVVAANCINLEVNEGEFVSLLGPSGCGKTTLLRILAGLEQPTEGRVLLGGRDVTRAAPRERGIGFVFQRYALFPHMSVRENVAFGLRVRGVRARERDARANELLDLVRLSHLAERLPSQISGGEAQRVALARALAPSPPVLLLDEPLAALDLAVRVAMQEELRRIHRDLGTTFVFVTHDQGEALTMSDRVVLMQGGRIDQDSAPSDLYNQPRSLFAATFVGDTNSWSGTVTAVDGDRCSVELPGWGTANAHRDPGLRLGDVCAYLIRPERVFCVGNDSSGHSRDRLEISVAVSDVIIRGSTALVIASALEHKVRVQIPVADAKNFAPGKHTTCCWSGDEAFAFPPTEVGRPT